MPQKVKFAIVGFGHIGKRHAKILYDHPDAELTAIADINPLQEDGAAKRFRVSFFPSIEDLLAQKDNQVISICTPNGLHTAHALAALESGCHVVVEKPMGLTKVECEQVIIKSQQISKYVFCVMQNRYSPPSRWLKTIIEESRLGKIYMVQINCYWNRDDRYYISENNAAIGSWKGSNAMDGGPLFTQFSHFIDIMYWLFGDITDIAARFKNNNHLHSTELKDDSGIISFHFVNGGMGCFNYSTSVWDSNLESSMTIIGEKGSVKVGGQYMEKIEYCHISNYEMPSLPASNPANDYGTYQGSAANHHFVIQNVIDTLNGKATIATNAGEGMKVVEIIERIYRLRKNQ
ncbi:MAG: Gfo/Idh/MocA family oxidoreductase [Chitinophagales bacterium]|nr:Gfo/Idh/MocA family oxidoreductase [Chitinophagales bacterium]